MRGIDEVTQAVIGHAIEVHRHLGPGLYEAVYERALCMELRSADIQYERQLGIPGSYKGEIIGEYRPDLLVADLVVVEITSVERLSPVHRAQMLTYLRVTGREVGLILNFNEAVLRNGIRRVVLQLGEKTL